jgi:hypothetical protein
LIASLFRIAVDNLAYEQHRKYGDHHHGHHNKEHDVKDGTFYNLIAGFPCRFTKPCQNGFRFGRFLISLIIGGVGFLNGRILNGRILNGRILNGRILDGRECLDRVASGLSGLDFRVGRTILSVTMADGQDCPSYRQPENLDLTEH